MDISYSAAATTTNSNTTTYKVVENGKPDVSNGLVFHMGFKATGIQATDFANYQEAFAAMSNN